MSLDTTLLDPNISELFEESPPVEADLIEELEMLLEQMQCLGYGGARGVEEQLCAVCDGILSNLSRTTLLYAVPWYSAPMQMCKCAQGLMIQRRSGQGALAGLAKLEADAEKRSELQLRGAFQEIKEKAQQVGTQRRRAEIFCTTYGTWWLINCVHHHHVI